MMQKITNFLFSEKSDVKILISLLAIIIYLASFSIIFAATNPDVSVEYQPFPSVSNTLYVDDDGGEGFTSIQDAINHSSNGDTVFVYNGVYNENIKLNKSISLIGESIEGTIIDGTDLNGNGINISVSNTLVKKFTISNFTDDWNGIGIYVFESSNNNITNNKINNTLIGILVNHSSDYNTIMNNVIHNNENYGINITNSNYTTIQNNIVYLNEFNLYLYKSSYTTVNLNNVNNSNPFANMRLDKSHRNNIFNNSIYSGASNGVHIMYSNNNSIYSNEIYDLVSTGAHGIQINLYSEFNNITSNNIYNNYIGISVENHANNNTISSNKVHNSMDHGFISQANAENNIFYNNNISSNDNNSYDDVINRWNISKIGGNNIVGGNYLGGNYWSNYNGSDTNHDGIGDTFTPFTNNGNITETGDYLPLVISPNVTSYSPTGLTIALVSTDIVVNFNKSMNRTTTNDSFSISPDEDGEITWINNNKTLTFDPYSNLQYSKTYTVTINWNATDTDDNVMLQNRTWDFTTKDRSTPEYPSVDGTVTDDSDGDQNTSNNQSGTETGQTVDVDENNNVSINSSIVEKDVINIGNLTRNRQTDDILIQNNTAGLTRIRIRANKNYTNTSIRIKDNETNLSISIRKPTQEDLPETNKAKYELKNFTIYKYLDISFKENNSNITEDLGKVQLEFKVPKRWIKNKLNIQDTSKNNTYAITLMRYHKNKWYNLKTSIIKSNETHVFFEAETPGFSTFAVVGNRVVETSDTIPTDENEIPWTLIIGFILSSIVVLIIILFKARYIYFEKKEKK